ncbi:hypothetical protein ACU4GI_00530 [Cupriavidus basilensis]|uniref:hypothetical protein n=1 Tax=Cupriavidus TaxID=106589 RepID=UPI00044833A2|nr:MULTISPECIES: hypothetical protein [Cupriavidus]KDP88014.1 hypothetical protein CF70_033055 [Cupriavidus sp. SK-3]MDF3884238.1 hypothetical protein [Cupriavidus basilensis]
MVTDKAERRLAGPAWTCTEGEYAIDVDILPVEDGRWGALVRLCKPGNGMELSSQFMLNRTFDNWITALAYTLALTRECVQQFAPATAASIARMLTTGSTGKAC